MPEANRNARGRAPQLSRRGFIKGAGAALLLLVSPVGRAAATSVLAVRVWPAKEYTRVTLEHQSAISFTSNRPYSSRVRGVSSRSARQCRA